MATADKTSLQKKEKKVRNGDYFATIILLTNHAKNLLLGVHVVVLQTMSKNAT